MTLYNVKLISVTDGLICKFTNYCRKDVEMLRNVARMNRWLTVIDEIEQ